MTECQEICNLSEIVLEEKSGGQLNDCVKAPRKPKCVLQFCDGVREEYSSEDEAPAPKSNNVGQVDPKTLNWLPWAWYQTSWAGSKMLDGCDYLGEWLADFFGITSPKYQFEINEYYRLKALESDMIEQQDLEMGGWRTKKVDNLIQQDPLPRTNA